MARRTVVSTASGTSSRNCRGDGAGLASRLAITAIRVEPRNGASPTSISNSTQPRL